MAEQHKKLIGIEVVVRASLDQCANPDAAAMAIRVMLDQCVRGIAAQGWGNGAFECSLVYETDEPIANADASLN